jgi:hypothetical protein
MEGFTEYESKPVTRMAYRVKSTDFIFGISDSTFTIDIRGEVYTFKAHEVVFPGDFIVRLSDDDIYHCREAVFLERNIV